MLVSKIFKAVNGTVKVSSSVDEGRYNRNFEDLPVCHNDGFLLGLQGGWMKWVG